MTAKERLVEAIYSLVGGPHVRHSQIREAVEAAEKQIAIIDRAELERLRLAEKWAEADIVAEDSWDANIAELQALEKVASAAMTAYRAARAK